MKGGHMVKSKKSTKSLHPSMDYCPHIDWHDSRVVSNEVGQWPKFTAWRKVSLIGCDGGKAKMHLKLGKPAI